MARVERTGGRAKSKSPDDSQTTVLPQHSPSLELHAIQFLGDIKKVGILLHLPVVKSKVFKLLVQRFNQNIGDTRTRDMGFFQCFSHGADPGFGVNARWTAQRIPVEREMTFSSHRI